MTSPIYVSNQDTATALNRALQFRGTFAKDIWLQPDGTTLRIDLELAEQIMIDGMNNAPHPEPVGEKAPPVRLDRVYPLTAEESSEWLQISMAFAHKYREAQSIEERARAIADQEATAKQFRMRVLEPMINADVMMAGAIVFGDGFPEALRQPDGLHRYGTVLIHASHPRNAEELYLRESQCTVDRIIRYRVPGLDDAAWMRQDEPRELMDVIGWRKYLAIAYLQKVDG